MQKIVFPFLPPTLNEIIGSARKSAIVSAKQKANWTEAAYRQVIQQGVLPVSTPCWLLFEVYYLNKRADPDNCFASLKFILDALVKVEILPDDSFVYIKSPIIYNFSKSNKKRCILYLFSSKKHLFQYSENLD